MSELVPTTGPTGKTATAHDVLVRARDLIAKPENWTQGVHARDKTDSKEDAFSLDACKWCAIGALQRAYIETSGDLSEFPPMNATYDAAYDTLTETAGKDLETWNDHQDTTHEKVMQAFDEAIKVVTDN